MWYQTSGTSVKVFVSFGLTHKELVPASVTVRSRHPVKNRSRSPTSVAASEKNAIEELAALCREISEKNAAVVAASEGNHTIPEWDVVVHFANGDENAPTKLRSVASDEKDLVTLGKSALSPTVLERPCETEDVTLVVPGGHLDFGIEKGTLPLCLGMPTINIARPRR